MNSSDKQRSAESRNLVWRTIQLTLQILFPIGFRYRAAFTERIRPGARGLVLCNHQSFLDPLLIGLPLRRPVSFMARDSLFRVPIIGWILRMTYVFPVDRGRPSASTMRTAITRMQEGHLVGIFPEGTRSRDGSVLPFKPGFAMLLRRAKLPIYPVGIAGANEAMPRTGFPLRPAKVRVVFGEPIPFDQLEPYLQKGREAELAEFTRDAVMECQQMAERWRTGDVEMTKSE